ncbi:hydrogenase nickel incorporation protein HypB [Pseudanabaena sp. PCC 6802]|uniref:hydrogenase nickel incorporation protein HypB n=1 Tax=Pseudanabaena sp. PCC 6802 TaxID=118173 RepID=UPI00034B372A|nr:hydrogenase nickel incorporation protein HypB [Pseudanabaena sp. PCC 6802]
MCTNCGCSAVGEFTVSGHDREHHHHHHDRGRNLEHLHHHHHAEHEDGREHHHHHDGTISATRNGDRRHVEIVQSILSKNERLAERNRGFFMAKGLLVLNVLSSPGSGKTALIERMLADSGDRLPTAVIVGDLATDNDAQRLRRTGAEAIQITTGDACHLEAEMVGRAVQQLHLDSIKLLVIENVGNLVCPAAYDLGEGLRVVVFSVTEGEDKPLKYPTMFKIADVVIISKIDIAEAVGFDRDSAIGNIQQIAPQARIIEVSARTGAGMETWYEFLKEKMREPFASMASV